MNITNMIYEYNKYDPTFHRKCDRRTKSNIKKPIAMIATYCFVRTDAQAKITTDKKNLKFPLCSAVCAK